MALTRTFLTAAAKSTDLVFSVNSTGTGFPAPGVIQGANQQPMQVDNEIMYIVQVPVAGLVQVRSRGSDGTTVTSHDINAPVLTSASPSDFPTSPPGLTVLHNPALPDQVTYGQGGILTVPIKDTKVFLAGTSAQTMTLAAPSLASNGVELVISSQTGFAHIVNATSLYDTGAAGSPFSVATWPPQLGATLYLVAQNGLWNVVSTNGAIVFT